MSAVERQQDRLLRYDQPEPVLTEDEVRRLQDWWDMEAPDETSWTLWGSPSLVLIGLLAWTLGAGIFALWLTAS